MEDQKVSSRETELYPTKLSAAKYQEQREKDERITSSLSLLSAFFSLSSHRMLHSLVLLSFFLILSIFQQSYTNHRETKHTSHLFSNPLTNHNNKIYKSGGIRKFMSKISQTFVGFAEFMHILLDNNHKNSSKWSDIKLS